MPRAVFRNNGGRADATIVVNIVIAIVIAIVNGITTSIRIIKIPESAAVIVSLPSFSQHHNVPP